MSADVKRLPFAVLDPALQELLRPRVERLGYLGEFFQCTGCQPAILAPFMQMTEALKRALPDRLTEVAALTIATHMGNAYELHQHERLSARLGFGDDWIAAVERCEPGSDAILSASEQAVQALVIAALETRGKAIAREWQAAKAHIGADAAIALLFLIGRYQTHALIVNTLQLAPPVPSIFAEADAA